MRTKGGVTVDWWLQADDVARLAVTLTLNVVLDEMDGAGDAEDFFEGG